MSTEPRSAIDRERDLGNRLPARGSQDADDLIDERSVIGIEQPVGGLSLPVETNDQTRIER
jgi:hypothetical protein